MTTNRLFLYNVARLYYEDELSQQQIANVTGISRPKVSRMLKEAKNLGIVQINLMPPFEAGTDSLQSALRDVLNLSHVNIVDADNIPKEDMPLRMENISSYGINIFNDLIARSQRFGVGWGATVYSVVLKLPHSMEQLSTLVVPLAGNAGLSSPHFQTNSIVDRIAEKYKCNASFLNAPAFLNSSTVREQLVEYIQSSGFDAIWDNLDAAFFSIGIPFSEDPEIKQFLGHQTNIDQNLKDAVGDILGHFFDSNGAICLDQHQIGSITIPLEKLYAIPRRTCIAIGDKKAKALLVASQMGVLNEIVTDSHTARTLIELAAKTPNPPSKHD